MISTNAAQAPTVIGHPDWEGSMLRGWIVVGLVTVGCGLPARTLTLKPSSFEQRLIGCYVVTSTPMNASAREADFHDDTLRLGGDLTPWPVASSDSGPVPGRQVTRLVDKGPAPRHYWAMAGDSLIIYFNYGFGGAELRTRLRGTTFEGVGMTWTDNVHSDANGEAIPLPLYTVTGTPIGCPIALAGAT
jgi:hypothetical protein